MRIKLYVDGDAVAYRAAAAAQHTSYAVTQVYPLDEGPVEIPTIVAKSAKAYKAVLEGYKIGAHKLEKLIEIQDEVVAYGNAKKCMDSLVRRVADMARLADPNEAPSLEVYVAFGVGRSSLRYKAATMQPYKHSRIDKPTPVWLPHVRDYLSGSYWPAEPVLQYCAESFVSVEADDILALGSFLNPEDVVVIASVDKDLRQIPGAHFDFTKDDPKEAWHWVSPEEGELSRWQQAITGDITDSIPGCYRIGPVKAKAAIEAADSPRAAAIALWSEFLDSDRGQDMCGEMSPEGALEEVLKLVTIGDVDAEQAITEAEEQEKAERLSVPVGSGRRDGFAETKEKVRFRTRVLAV